MGGLISLYAISEYPRGVRAARDGLDPLAAAASARGAEAVATTISTRWRRAFEGYLRRKLPRPAATASISTMAPRRSTAIYAAYQERDRRGWSRRAAGPGARTGSAATSRARRMRRIAGARGSTSRWPSCSRRGRSHDRDRRHRHRRHPCPLRPRRGRRTAGCVAPRRGCTLKTAEHASLQTAWEAFGAASGARCRRRRDRGRRPGRGRSAQAHQQSLGDPARPDPARSSAPGATPWSTISARSPMPSPSSATSISAIYAGPTGRFRTKA